MDFQMFRRRLQRLKLIGLKCSLYHWKTLGTWMSEMSLYDPFGQLKHKLWPKEGSGVKSCPNFLACRWCVTYHWKPLDEGYNFALDRISIRGLHTKLWAPKVVGISTLGISRLPLGSPKTKSHLDVSPVARHKVYYKGEGGGFRKSRPWWVLWVYGCIWLVLAPKMLQLCTNQVIVWFVQVRVSDWLLVILPNPILKLQHTPLPPKCYEPKNAPQFLLLLMSSPLDS
jgi:hypothetical protein